MMYPACQQHPAGLYSSILWSPELPLALIEEVVGNLSDLVGLGRRHSEPVINHQVRKLVTVDENDLLALNPFNEIHGVLREAGSRQDDAFPSPDVIHAADETLDDRSAHWTVPPLRLDAHEVQSQLVLLDHTVDAAVTRLARDRSLSRHAAVAHRHEQSDDHRLEERRGAGFELGQ